MTDTRELIANLRLFNHKEAADSLEKLLTESGRWKELCGSMLLHVEPGAGRRRAESYEAEYNDLVQIRQPHD